MRVALYARVSTTDQDCAQQLTALREYATARGWIVQGEYVDHGVSGSKSTRPALDQVMKLARGRKVDAVVCWKLDRWGRSMLHLVGSINELRELGVRFVAVTQGIDTDEGNPMSRFMVNLLSAFAEFEREIMVERTMAGMERYQREFAAGTAVSKSGKNLAPHRPKMVVNRGRILERRGEGATIRELAQEFKVSRGFVHKVCAGHKPLLFQTETR